MPSGKTKRANIPLSEARLRRVKEFCLNVDGKGTPCPAAKPPLAEGRFPGCQYGIKADMFIDPATMITTQDIKNAMPSTCERTRV